MDCQLPTTGGSSWVLLASAAALVAFGVFAVIAARRGHRVHSVMAILFLCVISLGAFTANQRADAAEPCDASNVPMVTTTTIAATTTTIAATTTTTTPELALFVFCGKDRIAVCADPLLVSVQHATVSSDKSEANGTVHAGDTFTIVGDFNVVVEAENATCGAVTVSDPSNVTCTAGSGGTNRVQVGTTAHFTVSCDTSSSPNKFTCNDFFLTKPSGFVNGGFTGPTAAGNVAPGTVIKIAGSSDLVMVDDGGASCVDNLDSTFSCTINSNTDIIVAKPMPILEMTAFCTEGQGHTCAYPVITDLTDSSTDGTPGKGTIFNDAQAGGQVYPGDEFTISGHFDTVFNSGVATCAAVTLGLPSTVVCTAGIESGGILNDISLGTAND